MELLDAISEKYQLNVNEIDQILVNFLNYVLQFKIDDIRDFLTFRKTTYKDRIKETHLKRKLREGIEKHVKNPVNLLSRLLFDDAVYRKFMKAVRKTQPEVKTEVTSNLRTRSSKWTSDELKQLRQNIDKMCQVRIFTTYQFITYFIKKYRSKFYF
ncbi:hypothetical protein RF11_00503 [Thelohanellus kitauei]|uniref:Uncharacterized protein n=1 Tax=Thelohanellus kitauei TaxID=669202 RepID=A0A0C2IZ89_THEKT|nr:hypothetical protein RF11_00503 [Thelohanellus kitauei]